MLSKLSKFIMGLLHKRPMNPYEISKLSTLDMIQSWFPMTAASIYTTVKNLEKKGYIHGEAVREGKFPVKTVYSLSARGEEELLADLAAGLSSYETEASHFGIAVFHLGSLPKEKALACAQKRLDTVETLLSAARERLARSEGNVPFNIRMMLVYKVNRLKMEIETTRELITAITEGEDGDCSITDYLK